MRVADSRPFGGASTLLNRTQPRRYKMFLLTWLGIYPLITGIFLLFGSWLNTLPLLLRTFLLTGLLVYLMTYVVMPKLMQVFHRWLLKP
jgi:antibiotic biosynthesis monooxygenase (ABM) superfamily enzyme